MAKRKIKLRQHIPNGPPVMFQEVVPEPGKHWWHVKITDNTCDDRPEFTARIPKTGPKHSLHEVAVRGAAECAEGRGLIHVTRYQDAMPTEIGVFIANGRSVFQVTPERLAQVQRTHELVAQGEGLRNAAAVAQWEQEKH